MTEARTTWPRKPKYRPGYTWGWWQIKLWWRYSFQQGILKFSAKNDLPETLKKISSNPTTRTTGFFLVGLMQPPSHKKIKCATYTVDSQMVQILDNCHHVFCAFINIMIVTAKTPFLTYMLYTWIQYWLQDLNPSTWSMFHKKMQINILYHI